ncbi:hypothetical protein ACFE04_013952 [Oxalis oulophora]
MKLLFCTRSTARVTTHHSPHRSYVPSGHFPVHVVGYDHTTEVRYIVNAELLRHPIFADLLNRSAHVFGYHQKGVLKIPIDVIVFEKVIQCLQLGIDFPLDDVAHE